MAPCLWAIVHLEGLEIDFCLEIFSHLAYAAADSVLSNIERKPETLGATVTLQSQSA